MTTGLHTEKEETMTNPIACDITMKDVAEFSGVSTATVSRAINTPEKLSPDTLKKVQQAFRTLGYQYNPLAAAMSRSSSKLIGIMIGNLRENLALLTLEDVQAYASKLDYNVLVANSCFDSHTEKKILYNFRQYKTAAVIVIGPGLHCHQHIRTVLGNDIPHLVLWDSYEKSDNINFIGATSENVMEQAVSALVRAGHRRIGLGMSYYANIRKAHSRIKAFGDILQRLHLPFDEDSLVLLNDEPRLTRSSFEHGRQIMKQFLEKKHPPTALISPMGNMAAGSISYLQEYGLSYPKDMSLVCLSDDDISSIYYPPLCAVRSQKEKLFQLVHEFVDGISSAEPQRITCKLRSSVCRRSSCMPPAKEYREGPVLSPRRA